MTIAIPLLGVVALGALALAAAAKKPAPATSGPSGGAAPGCAGGVPSDPLLAALYQRFVDNPQEVIASGQGDVLVQNLRAIGGDCAALADAIAQKIALFGGAATAAPTTIGYTWGALGTVDPQEIRSALPPAFGYTWGRTPLAR